MNEEIILPLPPLHAIILKNELEWILKHITQPKNYMLNTPFPMTEGLYKYLKEKTKGEK